MALSIDTLQATYAGRRALVTGHTGFKGGWLSLWLRELGAEVYGYSLPPPTRPSLCEAVGLPARVHHALGDVRDLDAFGRAWSTAQPEIVFHLAAQPLVRASYADPLGTLTTNVIGVAHALELARRAPRPLAMVMITSDKCYLNEEWPWAFRENDRLGGHDIYGGSKAAAELVIASYRASFLQAAGVRVASARAGNVIGGGDWAADRIVPDCMRSLLREEPIRIRSPHAVRPWQHVLEPISGYLMLGAGLLAGGDDAREPLCSAWNFGPALETSRTVGELVDAVVRAWGSGRVEREAPRPGEHEAVLLRLAIDKARSGLGWSPRWDFETTVLRTVEWYRAFHAGDDVLARCLSQIREYAR